MSNWELKEKSTGVLTVTIEGEEWKKARSRSFRKLTENLIIPGFRKGQAPRKLLERQVSREQVRYEAVNLLLNEVLRRELIAHGLQLADQAKVDLGEVDDDKAELIYSLTVVPEVKLGEYKGLQYEIEDYAVTDEEVAEDLDRMRARYAENEVVEGAAEKDDTVTIDYEGFMDGTAFEGGKGEDHKLKLGSGSFIPGFEDQLIGASAGEDREVSVTFPEDYHAADLAGKPAVFKVKVKEVTRTILPELNDEFAQDVNMPGVTNVEELKAGVRKRLEDNKKRSAMRAADEKLFSKVAEAAEMDIPEVMITDEENRQMQQFQQQLQSYGMSLTSYFESAGQTPETFRESLKEDAEKQIRMRLALLAVAKAEGLKAAEEDIDREVEYLSMMYQMSPEMIKSQIDLEALQDDVLTQKACDVIRDYAVGVPEEETVTETVEAAEETAEASE